MRRKTIIKNLILITITALFVSSVFASSTDGTIDVTDRYAWSENVGWLDFGTTQGNVHITDSALTGGVWGENIGWISLNCSNDSSCATSNYKVSNDGEGNLAGYAWSENTGWINFNPTNGGVTINSSGEFLGSAWGENTGWIVFNCSITSSCTTVDYKVKTDWRPQSVRAPTTTTTTTIPTPTPTPTQSSGGGTPPPPTEPAGGFKFFITPAITTTGVVTLNFDGGPDSYKIAIADTPDFSPVTYIKYSTSTTWTLSGPAGEKTLYVKFANQYGHYSKVLSGIVLYVQQGIAKLPSPEIKPPTEPLSTPISGIPIGYKFINSLSYGQRNSDVKYLQIFLKAQGAEIYPEGLVTGYFGSLTRKAIIRFQEKYRDDILKPLRLTGGTGFVGTATKIKINSILGR